MSSFIPDQLEQMSKKELLEFSQTAHEENVKLAKRVKELESYNVKLANESHEYQQRCAELDEIADTAFKYNHSSAQCLRAWNKFQQLRKEQSDDC